MSRKTITMLAVSIVILGIIFLLAKEFVKPIVQIPESDFQYFVVVHSDNSLKISAEKNEGFLNKIYKPCLRGVIIPMDEEIRVVKPEKWETLGKSNSITNGLEIDFYYDAKAKFNQTQMDSLSLDVIQNCGE